MEQIKKQMNDIADIVTAIQQKNDKMEERYDGLYKTQIEDLSKKATDMVGKLEDLKKENDESKKRADEMEKIIARGSQGKGNKNELEDSLNMYNEAFLKYLRNGTRIDEQVAKKAVAATLSGKGLSDSEIEQKTMQVGINPQGGYWVLPERLAMSVGRVFETSPIRAVANIVTTASDSVEMIIDDDESTSQGPVTETQTRSQTAEPDIGLLQIFTHEKSTLHKVTQKLIDDAGFDVGQWLLNKINRKLDRLQNTDYILGNGANKSKGFLDYAAWTTAGVYERGKLEQINSGAAAALTADGLIDLQNALIEDYQANANWMMRRQSWGSIIKLKESGTGAYLIDPQLLRNGNGQLMLLGNPVIFASDMPAVAASALSVAYGDFREGYTIVDKIGVRTIRDDITDKGRVIFYVSRRTGGAVSNYEAIKIQKVSA